MNQDKILDFLQSEVVIPDIVQDKANNAFSQIRKEAQKSISDGHMTSPSEISQDISDDQYISEEPLLHSQTLLRHRHSKKKLLLTILAATLALATISASAAVYHRWSENQKKEVEQSQILSASNLGVTVALQQSMADSYYAFCSFQVDGYQPPENRQPAFQKITYSFEGVEDTAGSRTISHGFAFWYDITKESDGTLSTNYLKSDGTLEYHINFFSRGDKDVFLDRTVHVEFQDLGYFTGKTGEIEVEVEGTWALEWNLPQARTITVPLNQPLSDTGITLLEAEISPLSLRITYDSPLIVWKSMPLTGVKLTDGTLLTGIAIKTDFSDRHETRFPIEPLLDIDNVEGLLFMESYPENGAALTEENLYIVDLPSDSSSVQ